MDSESRSTLTYRSNLQPLDGDIQNNACFEKSIRDPFALEILNRLGRNLTDIQKLEFRYASMHCAYAAKDDYPWGTIRLEDGTEKVVCKCINFNCIHFSNCRPDFDQSELQILEENRRHADKAKTFRSAVIFPEKNKSDNGDYEAARTLLKGKEPPEKVTVARLRTSIKPEIGILSLIHI